LKERDAYGATFFEIGEHTPIAGIRNGIKLYKEHGCDFIVAVGGGSPVDGSKAMLYNIQKEDGGKTPPQVAIPTTLSAAEYSVRVIHALQYLLLTLDVENRLVLASPMTKATRLPCLLKN